MREIYICPCSDKCVQSMVDKLKNMEKEEVYRYVEENVKNYVEEMVDIILNKEITVGKQLVDLCLVFLYMKKEDLTGLKFEYYLSTILGLGHQFAQFMMCYLDTMKYTNHGGNICSSFLQIDIEENREIINIIFNMINK